MNNYIILNRETKIHYKGLMSEYFWELLTNRSDFYAIGAISDNVACGYMIVEKNDMGHIIQDIFVHPDYRRKGIGTGLIHTLIRIAEGYTEDIDCHFINKKDDDSFKKFLESTGLFNFTDVNETEVYRGDIALIFNNDKLHPFFGMNQSNPLFFDFYDNCPNAARRKFIKDCMDNNYLPVFDISTVRSSESKYCYVITSTDQSEIQAYMKVNVAEDTAYIESVWCKAGCQKKLMLLFAGIFDIIREDESIKYVETCVVDEDVKELLKHLLPDIEVIATGVSAYWNYKKLEK